MFFLYVVVVVAGVGGLALYRRWRDQKQRDAVAAFAASNGWSFAASDPSLAYRWTGTPFGVGDDRRVVDVLSGTRGTRDFTAFDYRYETGSGRSRETHRLSVVALALPSFLTGVEVAPESLLSRIGEATGAMTDVDLESEDFNRRFRVLSRAPKLASDVLPPRTMELLLARTPFAFRFAGTDVVSWSDGELRFPDLLMRLSTLEGVVAGVPAFVWQGADDPRPADAAPRFDGAPDGGSPRGAHEAE